MATQYELINENKRLSDENDDLRRSKTELETRLRLYDVCEECKAIDALRFVLGVEEDKELPTEYHDTIGVVINVDLGIIVNVVNTKERFVDGKPEYNIDISKLGDIVYDRLITKKSRFTQAELRFIIEKTDVTIYDFAEAVYVHLDDLEIELEIPAENFAMCWSSEKLIRLFMAQKTITTASRFLSIYLSLNDMPTGEAAVIEVDGKFCALG